jgi:hypothetical protein
VQMCKFTWTVQKSSCQDLHNLHLYRKYQLICKTVFVLGRHCYYTFFDVQVFIAKKVGYSTSLLRKIFAEHCLCDADSPPPAFPGKKTGANKMRGMARNLA